MRARSTFLPTVLLVLLAGCREQAPPTAAPDEPAAPPAPATDVAPAATPPAATPPAEPAAPHIEFEVTSIDLGRVVDASVYSGSYSFRNAGTAPLEIRQVKPSCGCTHATVSKSVLAPGESGTIDFTYDPKTLRGRNFSQIQVVTNDPKFQVATLALNASITPLFSFRPPFLRMGEVQLGVEHRHEINGYFRDENLEVVEVRSSHPAVSATIKDRLGKVTETAEGEAIYGMSIDVVLGADAPWGSLYEALLTFVVRGRGRPEDPAVERQYTYPVYADLFGDLESLRVGVGGEMQPNSTFGIGNIRVNNRFETTLRLRRKSGGPLEIKDARIFASNLPNVTVETSRLDDSSWQILLRGASGGTVGRVRGEVVVETNLPAPEDSIRLPMTGMVY